MKLKIEYVDIDTIKPYKNNAKKHPQEQIDQIKKSIELFGMDDPIGIWKDEIVEGHGRLIACKELGYKEVPIIRLDHLTDEERKAYTLAHNKLTMNSDFDLDMLEEELNNLKELDIDMNDFGFDLDLDIDEEREIVEDEVPEVPEEPKAKLGDIYQLGNHRLMCGDSTKEEDVEKLMNGVKADMVFTDPPYNALKSWKKDEAKAETRLNPNGWFANDNMSWEEYSIFLDKLFKSFTGHSVYICCDFRIYPIILEALAKTDYDLKHCIVWKKNIWGLGKRYRFQHEFIVYGCKEKAPFEGDRSQSDVWEVDVDRTTEHKTPKPIGIPAKAIINSSKKDQIVLDVCGGSGSTLIACEQLNRKCYMMELDPHYIDVIIQRWENFTGEKAVKLN